MQLLPLSEAQAASIRDGNARVNLWEGQVRSGKTLASLLWWADRVARHDGNGELLMVGKTERTVKRNIIGPLTDMLGTAAVSLQQGAGEVTIFGRRVYIVGANDERAETKIRGGTFARVYGDELTLWPESFYRMTLSRMSTPGAQFGATTNPDAPLHFVKTTIIDRADELGYRVFRFTMRDNPALSEEFIDAISAEYTGLWRKRFIEGLWVLAEGVIWDGFDSDIHTIRKVPPDVEFGRYTLGIDYGTSNPFVALLVGDGSDGRKYVLNEWRWDSRQQGRQMTDAQYSKSLGEWMGAKGIYPTVAYVDPSAASFILQLSQDHGWAVMPAENAVDDGLRTVAKCIVSDRLRILEPQCHQTVMEIQGYSWDQKAQEKGIDQPIKKADHGPDALRYNIHTGAMGDIGDIDQYGWVA